ncbi:MAG: hypothetical protein K2G64_06210 [Muribaculaceae bacterium]|nr:hypothetical protein [Muribaculaceae bacterium]MDE5968680.1 hypothetical protein [Muribaculaceae bacterium]
MKKFFIFALVCSIISTIETYASNQYDLGNGASIVQYGNTWVIEDNNRQMSISIEIAQAGKDRKNNEMMYNVICNGSTKKVAKWALRGAIAEGVKAAAASGGSSLLVSVSALAVDIIYDEACDYWKEKGGY